MMKDYILWIESASSQIFALKTTGIEKTTIKKVVVDHHTRHKNDKHEDSGAKNYYRDLAEVLVDADQLLILGPGQSKIHFKDYIGTHQTHTLAKKVIGTETIEGSGNMSEKQMLAEARKFFKTYDLFNNPI
jgi:stalled ribosome rescue protein Dom34